MDHRGRRRRGGAAGARRHDRLRADEARPDRCLRPRLGPDPMGGRRRDAVGSGRGRRPRLPGDDRRAARLRRTHRPDAVAANAAGAGGGPAVLGHRVAHRLARRRRSGRLPRRRWRAGVAGAARQRGAECPGAGPGRALPRVGRRPHRLPRSGHRPHAVDAPARWRGHRHPGARRPDRRRHDRARRLQPQSHQRAIALAVARRWPGGWRGGGRRSLDLFRRLRSPAARRRPWQRQPALAARAASPARRVASPGGGDGVGAVAVH